MSFRRWSAALALWNVVLLVVVIWQAVLLHRHRDDSAPARREGGKMTQAHPSRMSSSDVSASAAPTPASQQADFVRPANSAAPAQPASVETEPMRTPFDWQKVESEDYQTYLENLRSIGCPEQTVKDIVVADVMETFAAHRAEIMAEHLQGFQYWKSDPEALVQRGELEHRQREVDEWMDTVLQGLIGPDVVPPTTASAWQQAALAEKLNFLPPEKREETLALLVQYAEVDAAVKSLSDHRNPAGTPDERLRLIEAYDRKIEALSALLTPEEYELLDMTVSWTADNLRWAMTKFEPTEEEYRAIFREWRAQDESLAVIYALGEPDPGRGQVFKSISEVLTPERYALYRKTWWR